MSGVMGANLLNWRCVTSVRAIQNPCSNSTHRTGISFVIFG
jgi:hypothetical protein